MPKTRPVDPPYWDEPVPLRSGTAYCSIRLPGVRALRGAGAHAGGTGFSFFGIAMNEKSDREELQRRLEQAKRIQSGEGLVPDR
jgi:hypothetical protein